MKFDFKPVEPRPGVTVEQWMDSRWQFKNALRKQEDFEECFDLSKNEQEGFKGLNKVFQVRVTPYYAALAGRVSAEDPIRKILMPSGFELSEGGQQLLDPLAEKQNSPTPRIIHRYPDRCLFLVTDFCSVYCRYCTRKHFTGKDQAFIDKTEYQKALEYISSTPSIREVILSGGDPLTLSNEKLDKVLYDIRAIEHVEIIRIGSRIPNVCPMRVDEELLTILKKYKPVFFMAHFNHPKEITQEAAKCLGDLVDSGVPVMNQMVLLQGVNNHPAIVQALCRRLLYLRVKPYYMFQCDPSEGTEHLRTSVEESLSIQKQLWGRLSGLAMPNFSLDIPNGGGKVGLVPDSIIDKKPGEITFQGWDGIKSTYRDPDEKFKQMPKDFNEYLTEWE